MHRRRRILVGLWLSCSAAAQAQTPDLSPIRNMVLTEKEAYLVLEREIIAAPNVRDAYWSKDGRFLLMIRDNTHITPEMMQKALAVAKTGKEPPAPPPGQISLLLWNARTRETIDLWKRPLGTGMIQNVQWLPDSGVALVTTVETLSPDPNPRAGKAPEIVQRQTILKVDGATGRMTPLASLNDGMLSVSVSPSRPIAVLEERQYAALPQADLPAGSPPVMRRQSAFQVLRADGTLTPPVQIVKSVEVPLAIPNDGTLTPPVQIPQNNAYVSQVWAEDGTPLLTLIERTPDRKSKQSWYALDPRTGQTTLLDKKPAFAPELEGAETAQTSLPAKPGGTAPLRLQTVRTPLTSGLSKESVTALWLEGDLKSEQPRMLLATEVDKASFSPRGDALFYLSRGTAWVTPLLKIDRETYLAMREKAQRMVAISNAKQLGLGLIMYCQDYDEMLPNADSINEKINPYIKNDSLFQGFAYTYGGGSLGSIDQPANTELGYVTGPGGRAIIYADGHVKWRNDPPKGGNLSTGRQYACFAVPQSPPISRRTRDRNPHGMVADLFSLRQLHAAGRHSPGTHCRAGAISSAGS